MKHTIFLYAAMLGCLFADTQTEKPGDLSLLPGTDGFSLQLGATKAQFEDAYPHAEEFALLGEKPVKSSTGAMIFQEGGHFRSAFFLGGSAGVVEIQLIRQASSGRTATDFSYQGVVGQINPCDLVC